jgi:hypothetical protein
MFLQSRPKFFFSEQIHDNIGFCEITLFFFRIRFFVVNIMVALINKKTRHVVAGAHAQPIAAFRQQCDT